MMRFQKTLMPIVAILLVVAFGGMYGHAADGHADEEMCQVCALLQTGASIGVAFLLVLFLWSQFIHIFVVPLFVVSLPVATPGRSPPIL